MQAQLQQAHTRELAADGSDLDGAVTRDCGAVEVRVLGPEAALTLVFDAEEAQAADVRLAVRQALARYRSSLGATPVLERKEQA